MRKPKLFLVLSLLFTLGVILSGCSATAENEYLPDYCQTYAGFADTASRDLYELIEETTDEVIDPGNYFSVISGTTELEFQVDDPNRSIDLGGIQCFQNLTSLTLIGPSFKDISEISALKNIQTIQLSNTSVISIDSFKNLSKIKELVLNNNSALQSVQGVEEMTKLTFLDLSDNGIVNIEGLNNLVNLETLILRNNEIIELPTIDSLTKLETLDVSNNNLRVFGEDLSGLENLVEFNAAYNDICDLTPLDDLDSLRVLHLEHNNLGCDGSGLSPNFDSLTNSQSLEELYLNDNELESISGLLGKDLPLKILHLENNLITDISPLDGFDLITDLYLFNNQISDISNLSDVDGISSIDLSDNLIEDISPLLLIENLERIDLSNNQISIIPDISTSWPVLSVLDLHSNPLTDTSGVEGHQSLEELILYNSGMTSLQGISNLPELDTLVIFSELEADLEEADQNPNNISNIINSFNNTPSLTLQEEGIFDFGFELGDNVRIIDSISNLNNIQRIDFSSMDIIEINENSIALEDLTILDVSDNRIEDISFVFDNPNLLQINVSSNIISNLELINGTDSEDLHKLLDFVANNITANNNLDGAFIDLPELQLIDLTNTSLVTINNSFNNLEELSLINIDSANLESITSSFNNIFGTYANTNQFIFTEGNIGVIEDSFNNGVYDQLAIQNQTPTGTTYISGSFNQLDVSNEEGILIEGNTFELVENSFNGTVEALMTSTLIDLSSNNIVTIDNAFNYIDISSNEGLDLESNLIETINNSINQSTFENITLAFNSIDSITLTFEGSTINDTLNLSNNLIPTITNLNLIEAVDTINLSNNQLTTVSFLDGIANLSTLDISGQINQDTSSYTLQSIDGINNMPLLDTLTYNNIGVTEIDGLKNIGIDSFELSLSQNNNSVIHTISSTTFENTDLTYLDLDNHQITSFDYLDNVPNITNLYLGLNMGDLTSFDTLGLAVNLEVLVIHDVQYITDFTPLAPYDALNSFTYETDNLTSNAINNLSGLDNLSVINIVNKDAITSFTNSFNEIPNLSLPDDYLTNYPVLSITNSFDIYTTETVEIDANHSIINSFNNAEDINIYNNDGFLTPNFDTSSFDSITEITFDNTDFTSYTFLNGYGSLDTVIFNNLSTNITDLNNANITSLSASNAADTVTDITVAIADTGLLSISSSEFHAVSIESNNDSLIINAANVDFTVNTSNVDVTISGDTSTLDLTGSNLTTLTFDQYQTSDIVIDADNLDTISQTVDETLTNTMTVNSNVNVLNYSMNVSNITINNDIANDITMDIGTGVATINSFETAITMDYTGNDLNISQNTLTTLDVTGDMSSLVVHSTALNTLQMNDAVILLADISTNQAAVSISGDAVNSVTLNNDSLVDLTTRLSTGNLNIYNDTTDPLNMDVVAGDISLYASFIPTITLDNVSSIQTFNLTNTPNLATLSMNDATINNINIDTSVLLFTASGSASSNLNLTASNASNLDLDVPNMSLVVTDTADTVTMDLNADSIELTDINLSSFTLNTGSQVNAMDFNGTSSVSTINLNNVAVDTLDIDSNVLGFTLDAVNAVDTTLNGANFTSLDIDLGTNDFTLNSSKTTSIDSIHITAGTAVLSTSLTAYTFEDTTIIDTLVLESSNNGTINFNNAVITSLSIDGSSGSLFVDGSNIAATDITGTFTNLNLALNNTDLTIDSNALSTVSITTDGTSMVLDTDSTTIINSATQSDITINGDTENIILNLSSSNLDLLLDGIMGSVTLSGSNVDSLSLGTTSTIGTLTLDNTNINSLTPGTAVIDNLTVNTTLSSITVSGDSYQSASFNGDNLQTVNYTNVSDADTLTITTNNAILNVLGQASTLVIDGDSLTSLSVGNIDTTSMTVTSDSLSTINTGTFTGELTLNMNQDNFNITSDAATITLNGNITHGFVLTVSSAPAVSMTTNYQDAVITASGVDVTITGTNLETITGDMGSIMLNDIDNTTFTLNATVEALDFGAGITASLVDITSSNLLDIDTNDATITDLNVTLSSDNAVVTTLASNIALLGDTSHTITLNSASSGIQTISTTNQSIVLDIPLGDITVTGENLDSINGNANTLSIQDTDDTTFTYNGEVNSLLFDGVYTVDTLNIVSDTITSIDTTNVALNTFNATTSATTLDLTSNATAVNLALVADTIDVTLDGASNVTITTSTTNPVTLSTNTINDLDITVSNSAELTITAETLNAVIQGTSLDTLTPSTFIVNNELTLNDTLITTLDFLDETMITNISSITMNTLDVNDIENVITLIGDTFITLTSPISDTDVYNYFYNQEVLDLTAQEAIDNVRYDGFRDAEITDIYNFIITNEYMDQIDEATLRNQIDTQTYLTTEEYFQLFLTDLGVTEETYGETESATARAAIQATLDDSTLIIDETALNDAVTASIEADADINATTSQDDLTFTLITLP